MQAKFGRNYNLRVQSFASSGEVDTIIKLPFTIEFDVTRSTYSSSNVATIRIYNLNKNTRNQLRKDPNDSGNLKSVILQAGYGTQLTTILVGNVNSAQSVRQGVDFITTISAYEFLFSNSVSASEYIEGSSHKDIITNQIAALAPYGIQAGKVGAFPTKLTKGNSYVGSPPNIVNDLSGNRFFIDVGKANCLNENEVLPGGSLIINSETGLLGTPVFENLLIHFEMLFEPRLMIGQEILLDSNSGEQQINGEEAFKGPCKVLGLHHRGMISESICGDLLTTVTCQKGSFITVGA